ncbi:hypothetical protein BDR03DRAFT_973040 [Suillus americanus]|nr:hypothetical protein BDR03DRAFT_973040 [Suillus americanus]
MFNSVALISVIILCRIFAATRVTSTSLMIFITISCTTTINSQPTVISEKSLSFYYTTAADLLGANTDLSNDASLLPGTPQR